MRDDREGRVVQISGTIEGTSEDGAGKEQENNNKEQTDGQE